MESKKRALDLQKENKERVPPANPAHANEKKPEHWTLKPARPSSVSDRPDPLEIPVDLFSCPSKWKTGALNQYVSHHEIAGKRHLFLRAHISLKKTGEGQEFAFLVDEKGVIEVALPILTEVYSSVAPTPSEKYYRPVLKAKYLPWPADTKSPLILAFTSSYLEEEDGTLPLWKPATTLDVKKFGEEIAPLVFAAKLRLDIAPKALIYDIVLLPQEFSAQGAPEAAVRYIGEEGTCIAWSEGLKKHLEETKNPLLQYTDFQCESANLMYMQGKPMLHLNVKDKNNNAARHVFWRLDQNKIHTAPAGFSFLTVAAMHDYIVIEYFHEEEKDDTKKTSIQVARVLPDSSGELRQFPLIIEQPSFDCINWMMARASSHGWKDRHDHGFALVHDTLLLGQQDDFTTIHTACPTFYQQLYDTIKTQDPALPVSDKPSNGKLVFEPYDW